MSHQFRSAYPMTQQSFYLQNQVNKFVFSTQGEAVIPGSVRITGLCAISKRLDVNDILPVELADEIYIDPTVGYHALFMKIESGTRAQNTIENIAYYPRLAKTKSMARTYATSLSVDAFNSVEGKCQTLQMAHAMIMGLEAQGETTEPAAAIPDQYVPFSLVLDIWMNKMDAPLAGARCGSEMMIQFTLATNSQVLFGDGVTNDCQYQIRDLKLNWEVIPESRIDIKVPVNFEKYVDDRRVMNSAVTSVDIVAPGGLIDAVHMTYVNQALEFQLTNNFLQCALPPGNPLYYPPGMTGPRVGQLDDYGLERLIWSINGSDTALSGFTQDNREEIFWNALRSLNSKPSAWVTNFEDPYMHDLYLTGIPFGGRIDLLSKRFAVQLYSKCTSQNAWVVYLFFRSSGQI